MTIARKLPFVLVTLALVMFAGQAAAGPVLPGSAIAGGQMWSTGGKVHVKVLEPEAAYNSDIRLYLIDPNDPNVYQYVANSKDPVGTTVTLGPYPSGQELQFGIYVNNSSNLFKMGDASQNPDSVIHAYVEWLSATSARVWFEDLLEGQSDHDYNDVIFEVCGAITPAPAPGGLALLGIGAMGMGAYRVIRRKRD